MYSDFDAENFPPEAIALLRLLGKNAQPLSVEQMEHNLDLSERSLGRAIRRLVSYRLIQLDYNGAYQLTGTGRTAYQQVANHPTSASAIAQSDSAETFTASDNRSADTYGSAQSQPITRRLTFVVDPIPADLSQPIMIFAGVNAPLPTDPPLAAPVVIALQLNAVGATLSRSTLPIDIPPDQAANPETFTATVQSGAQSVRVRADIYQLDDYGDSIVIGATYFDLALSSAISRPRAFGVTLTLR